MIPPTLHRIARKDTNITEVLKKETYQIYITHENGKIHQKRIQAAKEIIEREKSITPPPNPHSKHQNTNRPQRALLVTNQAKNNELARKGIKLFHTAFQSNQIKKTTTRFTL